MTPHGPVLSSLIRARLRGSAMGIIIPSLVFIGEILLLGVLPSFFSTRSPLSTVIVSALGLFGVFLLAGTALFQGVHPPLLASGASRKMLAISGWIITLFTTTIGIALWCGLHFLLTLLPLQLNVSTGNSIEYVAVVTLFLLNFGAFSHIASPALYKAQGLGGQHLFLIPIYILSFAPIGLLGLMAFTSVDPAITTGLTVGLALVSAAQVFAAWHLETRFTYTN
ncbi:MAG: hypothetical protein Q4C87_05520 [Actinomycetaceae bacterium]|nr:hypothetical protein [Actinomycetaceae bacterium]